MMSIDLIAKNILEYMIDLERFGWPPTCTGILYQPERPLKLSDMQESEKTEQSMRMNDE